jgi:hypothetical protein
MIALPTFRGALAGFNPLSLAPALWLNDTGSDPSVWTDISGNGRNATGANNPSIVTNTLNGKQVRRFDGTNDTLSLAADLALGAAHTIFVVAKNALTITDSSPPQLLLNGGTYSSPSIITSEFFLGAGSVSGRFTSERLYSQVFAFNSDVFGYAKTDANVTGPFLITNSFDSSTNAFFGKLNQTIDFATASAAGGYTLLNTRYPTIVRHVGSRAGTTAFWNGDIAEILIYPTALSATNRQRVERYLGSKYAISV